MKKITLVLFTQFLLLNIFAQKLTYNNLILLQKKDLNYVINYMSNKGWEFNSSDNKENGGKKVSWSLNKDWNERAQGRIYFETHPKYDNSVIYQTLNANYKNIRRSVKKSGFKMHNTEVLDDGIIEAYRKGELEFVFLTFKEGSDVFYQIGLRNFKDKERIWAETARILDESLKLYEEEQKREEERLRQERLIQDNYNSIIDLADELFKNKQYNKAINKYKEAISVKDNEEYPINSIKEINAIIAFLELRKHEVFDYSSLDKIGYNDLEDDLVNELKNHIKKKEYTGSLSLTIIYHIDTVGKTTISYSNIDVSNDDVLRDVKNIAESLKLKPVYKYEYTVNAIAKYPISIKLEESTVSIKKTNTEILNISNSEKYNKEVNALLKNSPMGKYSILIRKREINNIDFSENKIIKYNYVGGPSNMFLSLLLPGLGVKNVTGGEKNGYERTVITYGLFAVSAGCKLYSVNQYNKYLSATDQYKIDTYFNTANSYNKYFIAAAATGIVVWVYDVIWVANKGFKNRKNQKSYKNQFGINYDPVFNNYMLSYSINF